MESQLPEPRPQPSIVTMASHKRVGALASAGIKLASYFFLRWVRAILPKNRVSSAADLCSCYTGSPSRKLSSRVRASAPALAPTN